jgi:hypothetical protein
MQQSQSWEANSSLARQEILPMSRSPAHNSCANAGRTDSANSFVQFHISVALHTKHYMQLNTNWHLMTGTFQHFTSKPQFINSTRKCTSLRTFCYDTNCHNARWIHYRPVSYGNMRSFVLSKSTNFHWSQKTVSPARISSCRPAVLNTEFRIFPQSLHKNLGKINR